MSDEIKAPAAPAQGDIAGQLADSVVVAGKNWLKSKTICGLIITGLALAAQKLFGLTMSAETAASVAGSIVDLLCYIMEAGGLALAAYGRKVATVPLGKTTVPTTGTTAALVLALVLADGPAWAADGASAGAPSMLALSLQAYAVNVCYAAGAALLLVVVGFLVVDKLVLWTYDTKKEIKEGNQAVANFTGLCILAVAVVVGLAMG